jgi:hypothetical protein
MPLTHLRSFPRRAAALLVVAAATLALIGSSIQAPAAHADVVQLQSYVKAGGYRTLVTLWNTSRTAGFLCPAGAKVRVLYGYGWLSFSRQEKTLDCVSEKRVSVGTWSKIGARIQMKVQETGWVQWGYIIEG